MKEGKILIGVSGGIASFKVCSLINKLRKEKFVSRVVMSDSATKFVTPLTFESLTNFTVHTDTFSRTEKSSIEHIELADWCNIFVLIPATYNTINKIACGIADNLLTTIISALPNETPVLIAPAMNCHMWENPILQKNIQYLKEIKVNGKNKYNFIGPATGHLACGYEGEGILEKLEVIINEIKKLV
jgi:phosphopantothenoylcysteine decarboxylase/phosphopantothenate--cysteine ligase